MKKITSIFLFTVWLMTWSIQPVTADEVPEDTQSYRIQAGDVLEISVWKEPSLLRQVIVRPDGGLSFPLVGDIMAAGLSVEELRLAVTDRLTKYIPEPVVTVSTEQLSGNKFYVIGKVARPGEFLANRNFDVMQALSVAGGMTPFAAVNKIKILRRTNGVLGSISFRYGDIEKGNNLEQNILLESGDVVVVP